MSPLEVPEEFAEPRVERIHLEVSEKDDHAAEIEVSGAYLALSWTRRLKSRFFKKREKSKA